MDSRLCDWSIIVVACMACVAVIVTYGTLRCRGTFVDPLTWSPVGAPWNKFLDGWGVSHLLFYAVLGYSFPHRLLFITLLGVLWELLEMRFKEHPFYLSKCKYEAQAPGEGYEHWWTGRWQDIVNNTVGLVLGAWIATMARRDARFNLGF